MGGAQAHLALCCRLARDGVWLEKPRSLLVLVCPGLLSVAVINTKIEALCGGGGLFQSTVPRNTLREVGTGTRDRNGSGGHGGTLLAGLLPLACFLWPAQLLPYTVQDHLPQDSTAHSKLHSPLSISHQEKCPTDVPTGQSDGGNSSDEVTSSKYVKLTTEIS